MALCRLACVIIVVLAPAHPNVPGTLHMGWTPLRRGTRGLYADLAYLLICVTGTGLKDALLLLEPMANDPVNYVRQGALIASAMILVQQNEITCPKVAHFRQLYTKVSFMLIGVSFCPTHFVTRHARAAAALWSHVRVVVVAGTPSPGCPLLLGT